MPEKKDDFMKPANSLIKYLGLDHRAPKGGIECLKSFYSLIPAFRNGLKRIMSLGSHKR